MQYVIARKPELSNIKMVGDITADKILNDLRDYIANVFKGVKNLRGFAGVWLSKEVGLTKRRCPSTARARKSATTSPHRASSRQNVESRPEYCPALAATSRCAGLPVEADIFHALVYGRSIPNLSILKHNSYPGQLAASSSWYVVRYVLAVRNGFNSGHRAKPLTQDAQSSPSNSFSTAGCNRTS